MSGKRNKTTEAQAIRLLLIQFDDLIRRGVVLAALFVTLSVHFVMWPEQISAADDSPADMSVESLQKIMGKLISQEFNLTGEERAEIVKFAVDTKLPEVHVQLLLKVLQVSMGKMLKDQGKRGSEAIAFSPRLKAIIQRDPDSDLAIASYAVLVYGVEDPATGDAREGEYFKTLSSLTGRHRAELIGMLGNTRCQNAVSRIERLKKAYVDEAATQEERIAIIDVVYAGMLQGDIEAAEACNAYADFSISTWTPPELNRRMFHRLGDIAITGQLLKQIKK